MLDPVLLHLFLFQPEAQESLGLVGLVIPSRYLESEVFILDGL